MTRDQHGVKFWRPWFGTHANGFFRHFILFGLTFWDGVRMEGMEGMEGMVSSGKQTARVIRAANSFRDDTVLLNASPNPKRKLQDRI